MKKIVEKVKYRAAAFKLNRTEELVFGILNETDYSIERHNAGNLPKWGKKISELAVMLKLPRMTCHDAVQSLISRNLIIEKRLGKEKYYSTVDVDTVIDMVRGLYANKKAPSLKLGVTGTISPKSLVEQAERIEETRIIENEISIYSGLENCLMIWRKVADLKKGEKFICLQPTSSLQATIDKLGVKALYPNNDALNSRGIIVEGLIHTNCLEEFFNILKKKEGFDFALTELKKFGHRTANVVCMDQRYLKHPTEMLFMKNVAYIVNWKDEVAVEIHNKVMCDFLLELYEMARGYGQKINLAQYTNQIVSKLVGKNK